MKYLPTYRRYKSTTFLILISILKSLFYAPEAHIMYLVPYKFLYARAPPPPSVWALKPPSWALVPKTICAPMIYTALCIMFWMRAYPLLGQGGGGLGPGILEFFGPQMALSYRLDAISQGLKNSRIPGLNPLPLALVMVMHASKTLCTGLYKS
jgi:hypothetical protein